jgi:hypothetical protein
MKDSDDDRYKARNPMGRVGRPGELANMAAFLMSDEVAYINGEVIAIDGGMGIMGNGTFSQHDGLQRRRLAPHPRADPVDQRCRQGEAL